MREINAAGLALLKNFESLRLQAYADAGGVWTIGWGHIAGVAAEQVCTEAQAESFLAADLLPACTAVMAAVSVPLNDNQFAALVSFVFNVGGQAFRDSTLLARLNGGHYDAVPAQLARWNKVAGRPVKGLTRRRAAEAALWSTAVAGVASPASVPDAPTHLGHFLTLGGITVGAVSSTLSDFAQQLQPLAGYGDWMKNVFLAVSVAAAVIAVAARTHAFHKEGV